MSELHEWAKTAAGNDTGATPNFPVEGQSPSSVNDCLRNNMAAEAKDRELRTGELATAGTGNAYTLSPTTTFTLHSQLPAITFRADRANTGAATLAVGAMAAKDIVRRDGSALEANDITASQIVEVAYNSAADDFRMVSPTAVGYSDMDADARIPVGAMMPYGGASAPSGWLLCDGSAVSRSTFSDLFSAIGTTFGSGDGSTTFNVPNFKGRSPLGAGQGDTAEGGGTGTLRSLGDEVGAETHTLTESEIPAHNHTMGSDGAHTHTIDTGEPSTLGGTIARADIADGQEGTGNTDGAHTHTINSTGGGGAHNNMSPALAVNFIIKT